MGKSLFNTFCIIRKFHLSVLCPHVKKVQIALDEQQGNHDEIVKKENKTQLSKLPVSSCEPRVLVIFGLNKSHPSSAECQVLPLWHLNFLAAVWTVEAWWWVT